MTKFFKNNTKFEILSPSGFRNFDGIVRNEKDSLRIKFSDNSEFVCTLDHKIKIKNCWVSACSVKQKMIVSGKKVVSVSLNGNIDVYDPVNVSGDNSYISDGITSHNCSFVGSSYTLVSGSKLGTISTIDPIFTKDCLKVWAQPEKGRSYVCTVDTSEGIHMDYSAFIIFDISTRPFKVVATYKDNNISPLVYPFLILQVCQKYNDAYVLIETNNMGSEVANTLLYELEYEHVYFTHRENLNEGMGYPGVKTTKKVKAVGTSTLRDLLEQDELEINSHEILSELSVFEKKGYSYASADPNGVNDDLTACLWLFAWLTKQPIFSDLNDTNIRAILAKKTEEYMMENLIPFGGISDGRDDRQFDMGDVDLSKIKSGDEWVFFEIPDGHSDD